MGGKPHEEATERMMGLTNRDNRVKLRIENGFLICPRCRRDRKIIKVTPTTAAKNLEVMCKFCKYKFTVDIVSGQSFESQSPAQE